MLAIHHEQNSFSDRWIEYCENNEIEFKLVNCYNTGILQDLQDCAGLMWHWNQNNFKASIIARQLTHSIEMMGKFVFPNTRTAWHYDDKLGQKYLLQAVNAPLVPSYVFLDKTAALEWAKRHQYPLVFKLRGGAGSENVKLVRDFNEAKKLIVRSFSRGFSVRNRLNFVKERIWHLKRDRTLSSLFNVSKGVARLVIPTKMELDFPRQKGYAYFQDFISGNDHDIRVVVIGKKAFSIKRLVRENDFRASGSGKLIYDPTAIPLECIQIAFETTKKIDAQCMTFDFVFADGRPLIVEISYAFSHKAYYDCPGYWNDSMEWVECKFYPEYFMIRDFIDQISC